MFSNSILLLICMLLLGSLYNHVTLANNLNLTLPNQHPEPHIIARELQREVDASILRRQLQAIAQPNQPCLTSNPIDDCWRCGPSWLTNRQQLAQCALGFGRDAMGGKGGNYYTVISPNDDHSKPQPGTLRHAVMQPGPLWIVFASNMVINLSLELKVTSFKTIDGRGVNVVITGRGCLVIQSVTNVIVHNVGIQECQANEGSDGDGISVIESSHVWIDHCSMSDCIDGLIDVTRGSTAVTISNCYFTNHDKVMLLGHNDDWVADDGMQVTVAFNHFGKKLVERMPRCRRGFVHVLNNDYTQWEMYAIGGSSHPTIFSQGNRFVAPDNHNAKEVTKRIAEDNKNMEWKNWEWHTEGDLFINGAFFVASGANANTHFHDDSMASLPAQMIDQLTANAGVFTKLQSGSSETNPSPRSNTNANGEPSSGSNSDTDSNPFSGSNSETNNNGEDDMHGINYWIFSASAPLASNDYYSSICLFSQVIIILMYLY